MSSDSVWPEYDERTQAMVDAMVESEERALAARKTDLEDCDCKEGMFPTAGRPASRRSFLAATAAMAGGTTLGLAARGASAEAPAGAIEFPVPDDPTRIQGRLTNDDGGYGSRSQFETEARWRFPTATKESSWTMTPLESGHGIITPSGLHFERHHGGIPNIDPARHSLIIHGMVDRPMKFTMADLMRFPSVSRFHFIECSGNGLTEWREPKLKTVQGTHGPHQHLGMDRHSAVHHPRRGGRARRRGLGARRGGGCRGDDPQRAARQVLGRCDARLRPRTARRCARSRAIRFACCSRASRGIPTSSGSAVWR